MKKNKSIYINPANKDDMEKLNNKSFDSRDGDETYEKGHHPNSKANLVPFERGLSGNPLGKPSHAKLTRMLKDIGGEVVLDYHGKPKGTRKELVLKTIYDKAIQGHNIKYIQLLIWLGVLDD